MSKLKMNVDNFMRLNSKKILLFITKFNETESEKLALDYIEQLNNDASIIFVGGGMNWL
jgi:hypothetical protein